MRTISILGCLLLSACMAAPEPPVPATNTSTSQNPEKETDTQMRDAIQAPIQKAKGVEDQVLDGAAKQSADIEAAGG